LGRLRGLEGPNPILDDRLLFFNPF
jgi:hypothetical protein